MEKNLPNEVTKAIKKINNHDDLSLHEPWFFGNEKKYLNECIESNYVSTIGSYVNKFSISISNFTKSKYVIPVVNGTSALHIAIKIIGVQPNEEILIPSLTFVATANAVVYNNAIPHFIDIDEKTLGICPKRLIAYLKKIGKFQDNKLINNYTGNIIKGIIPMHTFGHPCNIIEIIKIAKKYNIYVIEDAAESLGSYFNNKHTGTFGDIGILSFNGNKIITTGGGGAILTNRKELAHKAEHLISTAKKKHPWEYDHDEVGYNYRMPNINAALGLAQIENIDKLLSLKRKLYHKYFEIFKNFKSIKLFKENDNSRSNYWLQTLILQKENLSLRDKILDNNHRNKIKTRPAWKPLHTLKPFKNFPRSPMKNTISLYNRIINLPSSPSLIYKY